jgi:hypothetical protein
MATDHSKPNFDRWRESCFGILDKGSVISLSDSGQETWVRWMKKAFSTGELSIAEHDVEGFHVSTVFLGINCNVSGTGPPLWFQTAVFRAAADGTLGTEIKYDTLRYSTIADAIAGHVVICEKVKTGEIGE